MATDEYIWSLVLQEAAAGGVLDLDYLNDDREVYAGSPEKAIVPTIENLFTDCLLDDLFDDFVTQQPFKRLANETIVAATSSILPEDVGDLPESIFYTDSFLLENIAAESSLSIDDGYSITPAAHDYTFILKPEPMKVASSPVYDNQQQYVSAADYTQSFATHTSAAFEPMPAIAGNNDNAIAFPDFSPELISRLLTTIANLSECEYEGQSEETHDEGVYMLTEDSANCSEAETDSESFTSEEFASPRGGRTGTGFGPSKGGTVRGSDRKKRKMQQNRVAAHRYRQKKKAEQDASFAEHDGLEKRNATLKSRVHQMTQEISYLRGLMADMMKVRSSAVKH